ncbi:MAG: glycosyl hydrolase-related protein, partial [Planctomycetota bacterium]|nr:glycosyl hydrolase-related protein [Planctomycetota bacterium]
TWVERGNPERGVPVLRMFFPTAMVGCQGRYEIPFGAIDRDRCDGEEVPALQWAMLRGKVKGKSAALLLLNDSKHGHSICGDTLRLTLIRSSYDPDPLPEVGQHSVRLALAPLAGEMPIAEAIRRGNAFNHPLRVVSTDVHKGDLPQEAAALTIAPSSLIITALKKAEDEDALILRLFETAGKKTRAEIRVDEKLLGKCREAVEVDLHERPLAASTARVAAGCVTVEVPPQGLTSLRLKISNR